MLDFYKVKGINSHFPLMKILKRTARFNGSNFTLISAQITCTEFQTLDLNFEVNSLRNVWNILTLQHLVSWSSAECDEG